jgi:signal transduction histidine kinase/ActR/RegA family two-component response regulator
MSSRWTAKSATSGYLVAVAATVLVVLFRFALSSLLGDSALFFPFVIAVTVAAWYGGLKPGLLSTVLGGFLAVYFFVPPTFSFKVPDARIGATLVFFVIANVTISLVCDALHKALRRVETGEATAMGHLKDVEARDQALRAAQEQLHLITDSMSAMVTQSTSNLNYAWVSRRYADWLGIPREAMLQTPIHGIIGPEAFKALSPYYERALNGETVRLELEVNYHSIGPRWINAVYTPTFGNDGRADGWVGVVVDVDAQKRSEAALRVSDRRKDNFLAVLAHELRNPLAPLRNSLAILHRAEGNSDLTSRARETMERQLSHMVRLVDDLLDLSRINSDKLELQKQNVLLSEVVLQALETVRPLVTDAGHQLSVQLPDEDLYINGDVVRLAQAFSNLLNNACKFTRPGGQICLTAVREEEMVVVTIRDNGIGIPADLRSDLFEMFTQGSHSLERQHGGLGIGLALVKRLIEMHDGEVAVGETPVGQGSEFRVRLPLTAHPQGVALPADETDTSDTPSLRILVVDDNEDSADSLTLLLEVLGNTVSTANDGEQGLKLANELRPDVVLLDIGLPKLNGYDVAKSIRNEHWGHVPILVAITGWGQAEDKKRSREAGFDHHLVKPVDPDQLLAIIQTQTTSRS